MYLTDNNAFKNGLFDFYELEPDEDVNMASYMKYDDWWCQSKELIYKLEKYNKTTKK